MNSLHAKTECSFEQIGHFGLYVDELVEVEVNDVDELEFELVVVANEAFDFLPMVGDFETDFSVGFGFDSAIGSSIANDRV